MRPLSKLGRIGRPVQKSGPEQYALANTPHDQEQGSAPRLFSGKRQKDYRALSAKWNEVVESIRELDSFQGILQAVPYSGGVQPHSYVTYLPKEKNVSDPYIFSYTSGFGDSQIRHGQQADGSEVARRR
jgi:hypothetical protein